MEEEISKFTKKHIELLKLEREESLSYTFEDGFSRESLHQLQEDGLALTKLVVNNTANVGFGRLEVELVRSDELPLKHCFSKGDGVLSAQSKHGDKTIRATVTGISELSITLTTSDRFQSFDQEGTFDIIKSESDYTYKCLIKALKNLNTKALYSPKTGDITRILFERNVEQAKELLLVEDRLPEKFLQKDSAFVNKDLANDQKEAVLFALKRKYFAVIQGPPGTGKTTTLVEIIIQLHRLGKKMLVCAPTNVAVDNMVAKLAETEIKPLRLGHSSRIKENVRNYSLDFKLKHDNSSKILTDIKQTIKNLKESPSCHRKNTRNEIKDLDKEYQRRMARLTSEVLKLHSVILCTLNSSMEDEGILQNLPKDYFDILLVDEASQALEASMWVAIPNASKLILAGDIKQLPPVVMSQEATKKGLNVSLMDRIIKKFGNESFISLKKQYRMNQFIMDWSNKHFYSNILIADDSVKKHLLRDLSDVKDVSLTGECLVYIDTCGCDCEEYDVERDLISKGNVGEAIVAKCVVKTLIDSGVHQKDIGVITPYNLQVDFIKRLLAMDEVTNVEVSSVDGFQGREKEAIILSFVRSNKEKELGFLTDLRRLNVAVTRAKRLLVVIADSETMEENEVISNLLKHMEENGLLQTAEEYLSDVTDDVREKLLKGIKVKKSKQQIMPKENSASSEKTEADERKLENVKLKHVEEENLEDNSSHDLDKKDINSFSKLVIEQNAKSDACSSGTTKKSKKSKNKNKNKEPTTTEEKVETEEDIDKLIAEVTKKDYICSMEGCKKSTQLMHVSCEFCKNWFCLQHGMQEIHGCGKAVRYKERKEFQHRKPEPIALKDKQKFARKLKELENARKPKKKASN